MKIHEYKNKDGEWECVICDSDSEIVPFERGCANDFTVRTSKAGWQVWANKRFVWFEGELSPTDWRLNEFLSALNEANEMHCKYAG